MDIQLLGIGNNGHIAFNEPCEEFPEKTHVVDLTQNTIEANARFFESMDQVPKKALTMGIGTIMKAKKIVLLANGPKKAQTTMTPFMVPSLQRYRQAYCVCTRMLPSLWMKKQERC